MQFMEPLGVTDTSVDAAWDFLRNRWRADVIDDHEGAGADAHPLGRLLLLVLSLEGGRRPAGRTPAHAQPALGRRLHQPGRHVRVRRFLPAGRRRSADRRQLRVRRPQDWAVLPSGRRPLRQAPAKRPNGSTTATTPTTPSAAARLPEALQRAALADRQRDLLRPQRLRLRDRGPEDRSNSPGPCARRTPPSSLSAGATAAGPSACARSPASTSRTSPSTTASVRADADSPLRGIEYRKDPDRTWEHLIGRGSGRRPGSGRCGSGSPRTNSPWP